MCLARTVFPVPFFPRMRVNGLSKAIEDLFSGGKLRIPEIRIFDIDDISQETKVECPLTPLSTVHCPLSRLPTPAWQSTDSTLRHRTSDIIC